MWLALQLALCLLMIWAAPLWTLPLACPCPCCLQQEAPCSSLLAPALWGQEAPLPSLLAQAAAAAAVESSLCCLPPRCWLRLLPLLLCQQLQQQLLLPQRAQAQRQRQRQPALRREP